VELAAAIAAVGRTARKHADLLSQVERFTFTPKFQVSSDAVLIAQSLSRPPDLKSIHGSIQNALSLVIDRIQPNAPARPKQVRVVTA
jgi:hypothetical protein